MNYLAGAVQFYEIEVAPEIKLAFARKDAKVFIECNKVSMYGLINYLLKRAYQVSAFSLFIILGQQLPQFSRRS